MLTRNFHRLRLVILAAALCSTFTAAAVHAQTIPTSDGTATLQTLSQTVIPPSDRIDLAQRYLGVGNLPAAPTQPLHIYRVGDQETFWATDQNANKNFQVTATLLYTTPHVFMWFDSSAKPDLAAVKSAADTFESAIYPTVHKYFGSERSPGIDGDVHLFILHARHLGPVYGYFSSADSYPTAVVKTSNQHNMFFMNLDVARIGTRQYEGTLAHEFQHMVHRALHPHQEAWINEGLSEVSQLLNNDADNSVAPDFLNAPTTQLDAWNEPYSVHYGAGYLFGAYFAQRFGADKLHNLLTVPQSGLFGFDSVLKTLNITDTVTRQLITTADVFADWQVANLLDDPKLLDGRYGYQNVPETLPPAQITALFAIGTHTVTTNQYGTNYLELTKPGTYTLSFQGQPTVKVIPTEAHSGTHFWWGGRADGSDARLTHAFDLSGVKSATLKFWLWHAIEQNYDYGYVSISTDGGKSWKALPAPGTTTDNPTDNAYGPGYTASSGADNSNPDQIQPSHWIAQSVDLSAYAGQKVLIRFEYVTDDAMAYAGMVVDDIQIPEIGYASDAENDDGGWQSEGWARIDNTLPQTYLVQQINDGTVKSVTRLLSPNNGISGQWQITVDAATPRVVIAVAGMTRYTYEPALFSYDLEVAR